MLKKICLILMMSMSVMVVSAATQSEPLLAQQAFLLTATVDNPNGVLLHWVMPPGYFLYKNRLTVKNSTVQIAHLGEVRLPQAVLKKSSTDTYPVYYNDVKIVLPILGLTSGKSQLQLHYQGCSDSGFCYPPQDMQVIANIDANHAVDAVAIAPLHPEVEPDSVYGKIQLLLNGKHLGLILPLFFVYGLILAFYPCNYPLVPIISGLILGKNRTLSTRHAFLLSSMYVIGIASAYAMIGVITALLGSNLQIILQTRAMIIMASLIFVLLALAMFDVIHLKLPTRWQAYFANIAHRQSSGAYLGVALMGFFSALIISPCATPPLAGALVYIAKKGSLLVGASALFVLGLGTGLPLLIFVTTGSKLLPKAGFWMMTLERLFGIIFLGVAIWLLDRILPGQLTMVLWAVLVSTTAIYAGALRATNGNWSRLIKGGSLLMLLYSGILLLGGMTGNTDPLHPLDSLLPISARVQKFPFTPVMSVEKIKDEIAKAAMEHKKVVLDFYAHWCVTCKDIEKNVLNRPEVADELKNTVLLRADISANNVNDRALLKYFGVTAPPTFIFFSADGKEIPDKRLIGEFDASQFLRQLNGTP